MTPQLVLLLWIKSMPLEVTVSTTFSRLASKADKDIISMALSRRQSLVA